MKALEGMKVIDFTQAFSGPFCTMQLADFGADVIKVERPNLGDQSREWAPRKDGYSGYYASINRNKQGLALDIGTDEGQEAIKRLLKDADVLVENFKVGTLEKFGLGYENIKKINPGIIYASISGFGQNTELKKSPAYDNIIQSLTGLQYMTGFPNEQEVRCSSAIGDSFTGLNCSLGIIMAYFRKLKTGEGARIDVSMFDCIFGTLEPHILAKTMTNKENYRMGNADYFFFAPYDAYDCKDGWFSIAVRTNEEFSRFCKIIGRESLSYDKRFSTNTNRCKNADELRKEILPFFSDKTREELETIFTEEGIINAPLLTVSEFIEHPHSKARKMMVWIDDPGIGRYLATANPMQMSATPPTYEKAAPLLGEDTKRILQNVGFTQEEIERLKAADVIQI